MSGHSKWSTIKRKKEKTDNARAKVFTKIGREIAVAVKAGGADPAGNSKLKDVIAKAKAANMPNDNIERVIKKAAGEGSGENYDEIVYEGYGPSGIAIIVETLTDNRNRTAADVRHYFDKFGGNMGQSGCVSFMFSRQGVILFEKEGIDEDQLMEDALEAGAIDFIAEDEIYDVRTEANDMGAVRDDLEAKGYKFVSAEVEYVPSTYTTLSNPDDIKNMGRMLEMFDENDDVQNVYHNWENCDWVSWDDINGCYQIRQFWGRVLFCQRYSFSCLCRFIRVFCLPPSTERQTLSPKRRIC